MRIFHVLLMTLALLMAALLAGAPVAGAQPVVAGGGAFGNRAPNVPAVIEAESARPAPGKAVTLSFVMTPKPGWHGYWENPGDAGLGMTLKWSLPQGVRAGAPRYPVPETMLISGLMNYVYEGRYAVLVTLDVPASMKAGDALPIRVRGDWLACTREVCVPEGADMALDLVVGDGAIAPDRRAAFDGYRARLPRPLGSDGRFAVDGGRFRLAIPFPAGAEIADPYFFPLTDGAVRYAAPQRVSRTGDMLIVETDAAEARPESVAGVLRTGAHSGLTLNAAPGSVPAAGTPVGEASGGSGTRSIWLALGGAILGGLLLNIMPCVFPILSLKALSLAKAGGEAGAARRDAAAYAIGVMLTCLALGGVLLGLRAGGAAVGWAFQLQDPRIILILLVLVTAITLNLAGLYQLRAVGGGSGLAGKGGAAGAFWTGALVAFVATPCTGPFMGAALGAALVLPPPAALAVFAGLGFGLALPFLLIGWVPGLRTRLPRPGPWMATLQKILAVPMALTALALLWLLGKQVGTEGMALGAGLALFVGFLLWVLGAGQKRGKTPGRAIAPLVLLVTALGTLMLPAPRGAAQVAEGGAIPFSEAKLAALRAQGKPVFLYFTADWCLTCKANEAAAIHRAEVIRAFGKAGVVVMVGDWTNADPAIGRFLDRHGRSGVPLYLWYAPGREPRVLPQILTPGMLTALS